VAALTRKAENIRQSELSRTLRRNNFSPEQTASLEAMTSALVRRLLHDPLAFIKSAPEGGGGYLNSIRQAFNLETDEGRPD
jgi:glutamyl-tRNA reductase